MIKQMFTNRAAFVALALFAVIITGASLGIHQTASAQAERWPSLTMTYQIDGASVAGDEVTNQGREVRQLVYRNETSWTDTVTSAPAVTTPVGTVSATGSYRQLNGQTLTEYDSILGVTSTTEIEDGVNFIPGAAFSRIPIQEIMDEGHELALRATSARVCFRTACQDNAVGIALDDDGVEYVWVDDARGIPLRMATSTFVVIEVVIDGSNRAVDISPGS